MWRGVARAALVGGGGMVAFAASARHRASLAAGPDCAEPVCDDKVDMFRSMVQGGAKSASKRKEECPLGRAELGRATWAMLHTTAAYYPENPTEEQKQAASDLMHSLGVLYACSHCRAHLAEELEHNPPKTESRAAFSQYVCLLHNKVNTLLDKPQFPCDPAALDRRWRSGCRKKGESSAASLGQQE